MSELPRLLLASADPDELADLRELLDEASVARISPSDAGVASVEPPTGGSYADRASHRARAFVEASGERALAICAGIDVYALDLGPGALTETFAAGQSAEARCQALLDQLAKTPVGQRIAVGRAAAALATLDSPDVTVTTSIVECEIPLEARGDGGYGLDAVTQLVSGQTLPELPAADRKRLGQRGKAVRSIIPKLS